MVKQQSCPPTLMQSFTLHSLESLLFSFQSHGFLIQTTFWHSSLVLLHQLQHHLIITKHVPSIYLFQAAECSKQKKKSPPSVKHML